MTRYLRTIVPLLVMSLLVGVLTIQPALAATDYSSGSLSSVGDGLITSPDPGGWSSAVIMWDITKTVETDGDWLFGYEYSFAVTGGGDGNQSRAISHIIFETSPGFPESELIGLEWSRTGADGTWTALDLEPDEVGTLTEHSGNPGMPESLWGVKIEDSDTAEGLSTIWWRFESYRLPVWGDFYAKDGRYQGADVFAINAGFGSPDLDSTGSTYGAWGSNTTPGLHIARPDTYTGSGTTDPDNPTPELPANALLLLTSLPLGLAWWRRRRS